MKPNKPDGHRQVLLQLAQADLFRLVAAAWKVATRGTQMSNVEH